MTPTYCPKCKSPDNDCLYSCPLQYKCLSCGFKWEGPGIEYLSREEAEAKRPAMYGIPACIFCSHKVHSIGKCIICNC